MAYLKKIIPGYLKDILHRKGTAYWISQAKIRVNSLLNNFLEGPTERYATLKNFTVNVVFDETTATLDVYITITPIRSIERINVTISVA